MPKVDLVEWIRAALEVIDFRTSMPLVDEMSSGRSYCKKVFLYLGSPSVTAVSSIRVASLGGR